MGSSKEAHIMKKHSQRKLTLARETVSELSERNLEMVVGGEQPALGGTSHIYYCDTRPTAACPR
jgi:hypothetical protein